ncbi:MAG: thioredoxin family protein [Candidatus Paceibacterota bacterium]|jgi:thiol-disulfide isomerase/thioredoxin
MENQTNRWKIATLILAIVSIGLAAVSYQAVQAFFISPKKVADKAVEYINKNLDLQGATAKLEKVENEKMTLQKITLDVGGQKFPSYVSLDGKYLFTLDPIDMSKASDTTGQPEMLQKPSTDVEGGFKEITDLEVCKENDKPIVYFFGSSGCPHCKWEEPILKSVVEQFGSTISYHENIDSETDQDVFSKYNATGSVPMLVIGCKYYRMGSGEASGEEAEKTALKQVICRATGNLPENICK